MLSPQRARMAALHISSPTSHPVAEWRTSGSALTVARYDAAGRDGRDLVGRRSHSRSLLQRHATKGGHADQLNTPTKHLREVLADQSDRGHRANVSG